MSFYIIKLNENVEYRSRINISKKINFKLEKGDIVYISTSDGLIQTRWLVSAVLETSYQLKKLQYITNCVRINENILTAKYKNKINLLDKNDALILEKAFIHKIKIYPEYNVTICDETLRKLICRLKEEDFSLDVYINVPLDELKDMTLIVIKEYGIIVIENIESLEKLKNIKPHKDKILQKLQNYIPLSDNKKNLNISYKRLYLHEQMPYDTRNMINEALTNGNYINQKFVNTEEIIIEIKNIFEKNRELVVNQDKYKAIKQILMPQYIIGKPVTECDIELNEENIDINDYTELTEEQILLLNKIGPRTCIEATAGSGKTVLLLAKAYLVAKANPQKEFLIICYNNKLAQDINNQARFTGKMLSNLKIKTLDRFIIDEKISNSNDYDYNKEKFVERVRTGNYNKKFGGVFIDEMQQLKDEWKIALYNILDENKYMVIAGDYYQEIRKKNRFEMSDEESIVMEEIDNESKFYLGEIKFKRLRIDINYRNTIQITNGINRMIKAMNDYKKELLISEKRKYDQPFFGKAKEQGEEPKYIYAKDEKDELKIIKQELLRLLNECDFLPEEILLMVPLDKDKTFGKVEIKKLESMIHRELNVPINNFKDNNQILDEGIKISSIGKAIGLDFRAVIIFGISNMRATKIDNIKFDTIENLKRKNEEVRKEFLNNLKNLYVAASRAKEKLIIIDDIEEKSLITEFVKNIRSNK